MLILASKSQARRKLLHDAGIEFAVQAPDFNEAAAKRGLLIPTDMALRLAEGKALSISTNNINAHVIGSDQTLECDSRIFSKPKSIDEAREHLNILRGKTHHLHSAIALAHQSKIVWSTVETVTMTMRNFSKQFLEDYLAAESEHVLHCVGAYRFEGPGLQLFEKVEGSYHAILGMPLLPLLQKLRQHGLIAP
jgi:septum formation protein